MLSIMIVEHISNVFVEINDKHISKKKTYLKKALL